MWMVLASTTRHMLAMHTVECLGVHIVGCLAEVYIVGCLALAEVHSGCLVEMHSLKHLKVMYSIGQTGQEVV